MNLISVEIFTEPGNNAVIRMPGRKNPGILVQGDTFKNIVEMAESVHNLSHTGSDELKEESEALFESLRDMYKWYELAIRGEK